MPITTDIDWRPSVLRGQTGGFFLFSLAIVLSSLICLYVMARTVRIHQSALVYETSIRVFDNTTRLAPYSIIPTLIALGLKLWFSAVGDTMKRFQPFLSMAKNPTVARESLLAEYSNTPLVLISAKASRHSHRILASVGLGAIATEACE